METVVAEAFFRQVKAQPDPVFGPALRLDRLAENDVDFEVIGTRGQAWYLELTEYRAGHDGPYQTGERTHTRVTLVHAMVSAIAAKEAHYSTRDLENMSLLLYVTDEKFRPSDTVVSLVQYFVHQRRSSFKSIHLFLPIGAIEDCGHLVYLIHPTPAKHWETFDMLKHLSGEVINLNVVGE